jgi:hypothetical protein
MMASLLVSLADISGPVGLAKEVWAGYKTSIDSLETSSNELIRAVAAGLKSSSKPDTANLPKDRAEARVAILDRVRAAAAVVAQKSPAEAEEYKRWLVSLANKTAEAAKEGGFLGVGGTKVTESESQAVRDLASALGVVA